MSGCYANKRRMQVKRRLCGKKMGNDSFYQEPNVYITMKCASCGETLLFTLDKCKYCGAAIEEDYAVQSAIVSTIIHRAIALANTIQTGNLAMIVFLPSAVFCYLLDWKLLFVFGVLLPSIAFCLAVIRWGYKYGDVQAPEPEFIEAKSKMKLHLHCWLSYIAIQAFVLFVW